MIAPNLYLADDVAIDNITSYVRGGGHLLMSYFSGIVDEFDRVRPGAHPGAFRDLLGLEIDEFDPLQVGVVGGLRYAGHLGTVTDWQDDIVLAGAEPLATYTDGELKGRPAVTTHRFGNGMATYLGTSPDAETMRRLVLDCARDAGITPVLQTPDGVEAVRRRGSDGTEHLFLLNHNAAEVAVDLDAGLWLNLLENPSSSPLTDRLHLPPYGAAVLRDIGN